MIRTNFSVLDKILCFHLGMRSFQKVNTVTKRGFMLENMITDKDKRKNWHFHILKNTPRSKNIFEKVHRPNKRQTVLNMLFIQNISDVLSTGDIAPELIGTGIEITCVKISPTCADLHVYWQIPQSQFPKAKDYEVILNLKAPKIRAELISRNLMGHVPNVVFVRDTSNAYMAAFEKALKEADLGPENVASLVPDDTFTSKKKKMYSFATQKVTEKEPHSVKAPAPPDPDVPPPRPCDMKSDIFGLNHNNLMSRIIEFKSNSPSSSNVITSSQLNEATDLFSNIPGTPLEGNSDRESILKQFYIDRKILRNKKDPQTRTEDHLLVSDYAHEEAEEVDYVIEDDFVEEDSSERF